MFFSFIETLFQLGITFFLLTSTDNRMIKQLVTSELWTQLLYLVEENTRVT